MASDDVPTPHTNRPGAASAMAATLWANVAGPRVNAGMMAVPRRKDGAQAAASASGVKASVPSASEDHTSPYPSSTSCSYHSRCSASGTSKGTVMP